MECQLEQTWRSHRGGSPFDLNLGRWGTSRYSSTMTGQYVPGEQDAAAPVQRSGQGRFRASAPRTRGCWRPGRGPGSCGALQVPEGLPGFPDLLVDLLHAQLVQARRHGPRPGPRAGPSRPPCLPPRSSMADRFSGVTGSRRNSWSLPARSHGPMVGLFPKALLPSRWKSRSGMVFDGGTSLSIVVDFGDFRQGPSAPSARTGRPPGPDRRMAPFRSSMRTRTPFSSDAPEIRPLQPGEGELGIRQVAALEHHPAQIGLLEGTPAEIAVQEPHPLAAPRPLKWAKETLQPWNTVCLSRAPDRSRPTIRQPSSRASARWAFNPGCVGQVAVGEPRVAQVQPGQPGAGQVHPEQGAPSEGHQGAGLAGEVLAFEGQAFVLASAESSASPSKFTGGTGPGPRGGSRSPPGSRPRSARPPAHRR